MTGSDTAERRECPACGAENPTTAEFCWQCFMRFGGPPEAVGVPAAPGQGSGRAPGSAPARRPGMPGSAPYERPGMGSGQVVLPSSAAPTRRTGLGAIALLVVIALLAGGGFLTWKMTHRHLALPETVGDLTRASTPEMEEQRHQQFESNPLTKGKDAVAALYGPAAGPGLLAVAFRGQLPATPGSALTLWAVQLNAQSPGTVRTSEMVSWTFDDVDAACMPVRAGTTPEAAICAWQGGGLAGLILSGYPLDQAKTHLEDLVQGTSD